MKAFEHFSGTNFRFESYLSYRLTSQVKLCSLLPVQFPIYFWFLVYLRLHKSFYKERKIIKKNTTSHFFLPLQSCLNPVADSEKYLWGKQVFRLPHKVLKKTVKIHFLREGNKICFPRKKTLLFRSKAFISVQKTFFLRKDTYFAHTEAWMGKKWGFLLSKP